MKKKIVISLTTVSILLFLLISIKPLVFFINYLRAKHYMANGDVKKARPYIHKTIFKKLEQNIHPQIKINYLNNLDLFFYPDRPVRDKQDNFYFQYFSNHLNETRKWIYLDDLSYFFLSDPNANHLTQNVLEHLNYQFEKSFLTSLLDFLTWQGNEELFNYILEKYEIFNYKPIRPVRGKTYHQSIKKLKNQVFQEWAIDANKIGKNLLLVADFEDIHTYKNNWQVINRSNYKPFGKAGFYSDLDKIEDNKLIRILNPFVDNLNALYVARCGLWYYKDILIDKGYYLFGFDFWIKTGSEKVRFYLGRGIGSPALIHTKQVWSKLIYILNNRDGRFIQLKPIIRMFGTGSLWVDNIFLSRIDEENIDFSGQYWSRVVNYE